MIYVSAPVQEWIAKYGLTPEVNKACGACKLPFPDPRPFRMRGYVGIEWRCPCKGLYSTSALMTPSTQEKKSFWEEILK